MTPQERAVIDGIFERLRTVASNQRDPETERYIADLIRQQPYAPYALAQSVYVQEQAILNQQQQIEELQAENARLQSQPQKSGGFLSGLFGGGQPAQPQAPGYGQRSPQPGYAPQPQQAAYAPQPQQAPPAGPWGQPQQQPPAQRQGMGFLGTAATAAVGVAGGMLVANALSSAFSGNSAKAATPPESQNFMNSSQNEQGGAMDSDRHNTGYDDNDGGDGGYDGGDSYDA